MWGESPFDRQERIRGFDQKAVEKAFVWIFGVNGLGRTLAELLVRKGYARIGLCDPDEVELTNLHRTLWSHTAIGKMKVIQALKELSEIAPSRSEILAYVGTLEEVIVVDAFLENVSACLVGIDNDRGRAVAAKALRQKGIPAVFYSLSPDTYTYEVFVQDKDGPCWACLHPERFLEGIQTFKPAQCPKVPSIADTCFMAIGLCSYALDSLVMGRFREWNFRQGHLHGQIPESIKEIGKRPDCPACGCGGKK